MKQRKIFITEVDKKRLDELINVSREFDEHAGTHLNDLAEELARAKIVEPREVPANVVTMNSKVVIHDLSTSDEDTYTLVFPEQADIDSGAISVLAPIGMAILGYQEGSTVEWPVPSGIRRFRIEKIVYQPEAEGDFDQ